MCTVGIVNITGKLNEVYIEALREEKHKVVFMESEELLSAEQKTDAVIIYDEEEKEVGAVCNLILQIKERTQSYIWTFSNKISEVNRLVYLQLGANGNLQSQCTPTEVQLIVKNTVNHLEQEKMGRMNSFEQQNSLLKLNDKNQSIFIDGGMEIELTRLEYRLITVLYSELGRVFEYDELRELLWKEKCPQDYKTRIANLVFYLRKKVEENSACSEFIRTIRSKGYMLRLEIES